MLSQKSQRKLLKSVLAFAFIVSFLSNYAISQEKHFGKPSNFGLPGIIDLPNAKRFPDGELIISQQLHKSLARSGISFQALPRLGFSFRYTGHGINGEEAYGRINHDRSFDAHISLLDEKKYLPAISIGLRDFIGTGWYSSEYIVGTKSIGNFSFTAGLGFGRLAGKNTFSNPLSILSSKFDNRKGDVVGVGGTLGTINWFQGEASAFYGLRYKVDEKITIEYEHTTDQMLLESSYLSVRSPWNLGVSYQLNDYVSLSTQYLHGSQISVTAQVITNPARPPLLGGKDLAPVPMRLRGGNALPVSDSFENKVRKVLQADNFKLLKFEIKNETVSVTVTNTKFRSTAQALGRLASSLQRFTSDDIKFANIHFQSHDILIASYRVDLDDITFEQFDPTAVNSNKPSIRAFDAEDLPIIKNDKRFTWGLGPYIAHRLFNPDLPLSMETGVEIEAGYKLAKGLKISGALRKSLLTNLTKNKRRSNSDLPRVHSNWALYDFAGQKGHIHSLRLSYISNIAPGFYGRAHAGLLEPFFAGIGGEILFKPAEWPIGIGLDIHHVQMRDYDMKFDFLDYKTTVGHLSLYYDAGGLFNIEVNAGRYLAGDWGATTTISRKFGSGWEVGGYATLTDVPFHMFGEGSFDKAIYVSLPIDWITSTPNQAQRILTLRPITRDGGANLASARSLNRHIEHSQNSAFQREFGRLWK